MPMPNGSFSSIYMGSFSMKRSSFELKETFTCPNSCDLNLPFHFPLQPPRVIASAIAPLQQCQVLKVVSVCICDEEECTLPRHQNTNECNEASVSALPTLPNFMEMKIYNMKLHVRKGKWTQIVIFIVTYLHT